VTDRIIAYLNSNSEFRNRFGFKKKIDLKNWELWMDEDNWNVEVNSLEKKKFIEFVNKMLSGEKEIPVKINELWNSVIPEPEVFKWYILGLWSNPYERIMNNLRTEDENP
jgi:hypothetical protein